MLKKDSKLPMKATNEAAGFDVYSNEIITIPPHSISKISTGISLQIPNGFYVKLYDRSSMAMKQIYLRSGVIDSDYTGELYVCLSNNNESEFTIHKNMKIAQFIVHETVNVQLSTCVEFDKETERGNGGFGSTSFF